MKDHFIILNLFKKNHTKLTMYVNKAEVRSCENWLQSKTKSPRGKTNLCRVKNKYKYMFVKFFEGMCASCFKIHVEQHSNRDKRPCVGSKLKFAFLYQASFPPALSCHLHNVKRLHTRVEKESCVLNRPTGPSDYQVLNSNQSARSPSSDLSTVHAGPAAC